MKYLQQRASPWVSAAVLGGGLVSAVILFFLVRIESNVQALNSFGDYETYLEN